MKFYRANAPVYYTDLKDRGVVNSSAWFHSKANTWLQGDMVSRMARRRSTHTPPLGALICRPHDAATNLQHMNNMGSFGNDADKVVFDANDFDEAWVANFLYDAYRLACSIVLVARQNGLGDTDATTLVKAFASNYMTTVRGAASLRRHAAARSSNPYPVPHHVPRTLACSWGRTWATITRTRPTGTRTTRTASSTTS